MSAATLEDGHLTEDQPAGNGTARASSLDELERALTIGTPSDQQEAGRVIVRFYVDQGADLEGPSRLTGVALAERHTWSGRWWRDRLGEVRAERKAGTPANLSIVPSDPTRGTSGTTIAPTPPTDLQTPSQRNTARATGATGEPAELIAAGDGTDGKPTAPVASPSTGPVAGVASSPVPPAPLLPPAPALGSDGSANPATRATSHAATPSTRADLATAQHTARSPRATPVTLAARPDPHMPYSVDDASRGTAGVAGTANAVALTPPTEPTAPNLTAAGSLEATHSDPGTASQSGWFQPGQGTGTGWPETSPPAAAAPELQHLPTTAPQHPSEPSTTPTATPAPWTLAPASQSRDATTNGTVESLALLQAFAAGVMAAQTSSAQPIQPTIPSDGPDPAPDRTEHHGSQVPEAAPTALARPLPADPDEPEAALPPVENPPTGPLPRPIAVPSESTEPQPPAPAAAPTLATPATLSTGIPAEPAEHIDATLATATPPASPATVASSASVASTDGEAAAPSRASASGGPAAVDVASSAETPALVQAPARAGATKLQYAFYGVASLFALIGQVWAALDHIAFGDDWPIWLRAIVMAPALAVIELAGVATSHQADLRRRLGEQAYGYRTLSLMAAVVAAGVNLLGHWGQWFPAVGFTALSIFAYCSWLMQSAAQRRDTLRAAGQMAITAPVFGPLQWVVQPKLTWRARTIAISDGLGRTESLKLAGDQIRAEARNRALAAKLRKVIKAHKKDANGARIALATIDHNKLAARLEERADYDLWTDHLSADLVPPAPGGKTG